MLDWENYQLPITNSLRYAAPITNSPRIPLRPLTNYQFPIPNSQLSTVNCQL
ncbi:MAG: hypothetical protein HC849_26075, partial [Oscillatoriales cyanobacterium RU_3_3]|nr:hypothetical protein [Oscillatoriales cyanobacterium RU_3_3]